MSSRTYANSACIVSTEFVQKTIPLEYKAFMKSFVCVPGKPEYSFDEFASEAMFSHYPDGSFPDKICTLYSKMRDAFCKKTRLDLSLLRITDEDDSENEGSYWIVENAIDFTPAAKKIQKHLSALNYTTWG